MYNLENIRHIYFLGIGGIGMSALARYFLAKGMAVSGYDKTPSKLTEDLSAEGIAIHYVDDVSLIPDAIDLIIYTPAIPEDLNEYKKLKVSGIPMFKRSRITGMITRDKTTIAVAGSHGKTSISSLTAHILMAARFPVTALIGGISRNYASNFITSGKEEIMIVEADEYDRSFLELCPDIAVISAMDPDHLDIYGTAEDMEDSYAEFAGRIKSSGTMVIRHDLNIPLRRDIRRIGYAVEERSDAYAFNLRTGNGFQVFDLFLGESDHLEDIKIQIPGRHNVENAVAASSICHALGVRKKEIRQGIESFRGVKRRFDIRIQNERMVYIDDYAHHPRELEAFIHAVRELYPEARLTGLFQPHLFSRTRDFAEGFASAMDLLDEPWLMEIYPAREMPIPGVTSSLVFDKMNNPDKRLMSREEALSELRRRKPEVFLTIGAGDIDQMVQQIEEILMA